MKATSHGLCQVTAIFIQNGNNLMNIQFSINITITYLIIFNQKGPIFGYIIKLFNPCSIIKSIIGHSFDTILYKKAIVIRIGIHICLDLADNVGIRTDMNRMARFDL